MRSLAMFAAILLLLYGAFLVIMVIGVALNEAGLV